jgi:hypothetical protein
MHTNITALYVRKDSIYKQLGLDCWDIERDARLWPGGNACIAHPPCRAWGQLAHFAKPRADEKDLAIIAISQVRKNGGVLEHPRGSKLWPHLQLPVGLNVDKWGGYTLSINQHWFGHQARKKTFLYICGIDQLNLPAIPICFDAYTYCIARSGNCNLKHVTHKEREKTPLKLAQWLIKVCTLINQNKYANISCP